MPKTINTPRDELICGKIDMLESRLAELNLSPDEIVPLLFITKEIRHDAERMEAKLVERKREAEKRNELFVGKTTLFVNESGRLDIKPEPVENEKIAESARIPNRTRVSNRNQFNT